MQLDPQAQSSARPEGDGFFSVGVVGNYADSDETRFLLTPEASGLICSSGIRLVMEADAGIDISFTNEAYAGFGVEIGTREQALKCDIVLDRKSVV